MYPESCEYLWWVSVSAKLRVMTRGEIETVNEDDVGHLRISLLIVIGDLAFRVRRSGYFRDGKVWIEVYEADSLKVSKPIQDLLQDTSKVRHGGKSHYQGDKQGD